jgi:hypothetical protein
MIPNQSTNTIFGRKNNFGPYCIQLRTLRAISAKQFTVYYVLKLEFFVTL